MEQVFVEEDGDRGANRLRLPEPKEMRGPDNMHAFWDQLLGNEFSLEHSKQRIAEIRGDRNLVAKAQAAIRFSNGLDPQVWLAESRALSADNVYAPEVIDALHLVSRGIAKEPPPMTLSRSYRQNAEQLAKRRAAEAGYRLAETWRKAL
jgi:hypothetical protein